MSEHSRTSLPADEVTVKAVVAGILLGIVFGAANAYLGLRVGLTVSASIPAAVMTVALFTATRQRGSILEANLAQTIASASTSLATGTIFTIPALFMWGFVPAYLQVVVLCYLGAVLGLAAMIPLRRMLIVEAHDELPYPEGTACAQVLKATTSASGASVWIFRGMALAAAIKVLLALVFLVPASVHAAVPFLPKGQLELELAPALVGVGYILGYRQSGVLVAGSLVSALVLTPLVAWIGASLTQPLYPETTRLITDMSATDIWSRYVRYIGAGAVAVAGIISVIAGLPTMSRAFLSVVRSLGRERSAAPAAMPATDRDLPGWFVAGAVVAVIVIASTVPGIFAGNMGALGRAICGIGVGVFGLMFVAVAARIVGIVGVSSQPTSGVTLITLLGIASIFAALGWNDAAARAAVLTVGTIVAVAASKAGDISQDLKTGALVGATPARQQLGQLVGASFACSAVAATVLLLGSAYTFGSRELPAPQATLMKTIVEGVLAGAVPWGLVLSGGGLAISSWLCGVSPLAFSIGVYLPLGSMLAIYLGGCVRGLHERRGQPAAGVEGTDPGILAASGLVAGEGLAGVLIAALVALQAVPRSLDSRLAGILGNAGTLVLAALVCWFLAATHAARRHR